MVMVKHHMISSHLLRTNSWQVYDTNMQIPEFRQPGFFFFIDIALIVTTFWKATKVKITGDEVYLGLR